MKTRLLVSLTLSISLLCLNVSAYAEELRVTTNDYEDCSLQIKGNYLVWQGYVDGDWEIFLYSMADGAIHQITDNSYDDISPQTDGTYVVWQGYNRKGGEIFLYHVDDRTPITDENADLYAITNNPIDIDCSPQIANGQVVWTWYEVEDSVKPGEIFLYNTGTGLAERLTDNALDDSFPRINLETLIWVRADDVSNTIYIYNLDGGDPEPAPEGFVWQDSPQTDGDLTVLTRHDGKDREIFVYSASLQVYEQMTINDIEDRYPRISGNNVAWVGGESQDSEIYLAIYRRIALVSPRDGALLPKKPPTTFSWCSVGYGGFKVEFSGNSNFPGQKTLTLPLGSKWLSDTSFTPTSRQWWLIRKIEKISGRIYWRVKAKDADENIGFSETWSFSIERIKKSTKL